MSGYRGQLARRNQIKKILHVPSSTYNQTLNFHIRYGIEIFDENFNNLKPVELVQSEFGDKDPVFLFPGADGKMKFYQKLIQNLRRPVYCFQYPFEKSTSNVSSIAETIIQFLKDYARHEEKLNIVAHSFGGLIALSVIKEVQYSNEVHLCLTDSTPYALKYMMRNLVGDIYDGKKFENNVLINSLHGMNVNVKPFEKMLENLSEWDEKVENFIEKLSEHSNLNKHDLHIIIDGIYGVFQAILLYDEKTLGKLNAKMSLIRSLEKILPFPDDFHEKKYFTEPTRSLLIKGHHFNMLKYPEAAHIINEELEKS